MSTELLINKLSKYEQQTLAEMAKYGLYYWRKASVAKLVNRGFAEPDPADPRAFRLTAAGFAAYEALP